MSAPEHKKNSLHDGESDALSELERKSSEDLGVGNHTPYDVIAGDLKSDVTALGDAALKQGGD